MKTPIAILVAVLFCACAKKAPPKEKERNPIKDLIATNSEFDGVLFREVVKGATGRDILPVVEDDPTVAFLANVFEEILAAFNRPDSPTSGLRRINEASRFFEEAILERIDASPDYTCDFPQNTEGKIQRAGYPDLRIAHKPTGRIYYLDPKLFESGSATSTLRTFYFEPKTKTNKILDDARHLVVGIEHDGNDGQWKFLRWHLVDLHKFRVRLKAEFQASNKDLYNEGLLLESRKSDP